MSRRLQTSKYSTSGQFVQSKDHQKAWAEKLSSLQCSKHDPPLDTMSQMKGPSSAVGFLVKEKEIQATNQDDIGVRACFWHRNTDEHS